MKVRLPVLVAAFWWGSLGAVGFLVVPLLFTNLPTPQVAGGMAAKLFTAETWTTLLCGLLLLMMSKSKAHDPVTIWARELVPFIVAAMLSALISEFGVAPRIIARENLALWHSLGSGLYLLQWLCALKVLWGVAGRS
jgi:hypothetical protein